MSQENVAFVEALLAGATQMDKQELLAALPELIAETCTPDIEWVEHPQRADRRICRGHEAVRESWERWLEQWELYGFEAERFVDCGESVLVVAREHGRGATSGACVSTRNYVALTIHDAKVARYREFYDEREALKALGLESKGR